MAGKNQVNLTFAGDSSDLEKAFAKVGGAADDMKRDVGAASKTIGREGGAGFDRAGEAADSFDTKSMGARDGITGVQDSMMGFSALAKGDTTEGLLLLGSGFSDIGSSLYNFVIPSLKSLTRAGISNAVATVRQTVASGAHKVAMLAGAAATRVMAVAQCILNAAMRANPIGIIITILFALGAVIVTLWKKSQTFRNIVTGAFNAVKRAASAVWNWIKSNWRLLLAIITGPIGIAIGFVSRNFGKIKRFARNAFNGVKSVFSSIGSAIAAPFRAAFQGIKNIWNSTVGGRGFTVPNWVPFIGGRQFRIPTLHQGGVVPGAPGQEQLALLQAGERVSRAGSQSGAPRTVRVDLGPEIMNIIRRQVRAEGGDVQIVLGT